MHAAIAAQDVARGWTRHQEYDGISVGQIVIYDKQEFVVKAIVHSDRGDTWWFDVSDGGATYSYRRDKLEVKTKRKGSNGRR